VGTHSDSSVTRSDELAEELGDMSLESVKTPTSKKWFDRLQSVLHEEAKLAGLLGHGTLIGNARELFVQRILKSFLPPIVHIGTGKIVSVGLENESKQVDVILYDSRFPVLEVSAGVGLYPVEGVIAAIEVKSRSTREKLTDALDNCASVAKIPVGLQEGEYERREAEMLAKGAKQQYVAETLHLELHPPTYVFAFETELSQQTTAEVIATWLGQNFPDAKRIRVPLPRLCALGGVVAIQNTSPMLAEVVQSFDSTSPPQSQVMGVWTTQRPFGILACHLLWAVEQRFGPALPHGGVKYAVSAALPADHYFREDLNNQCGSMIYAPRAAAT
jgi:hypothetical protein